MKPGASAPLVTYRGYGDDYSLELRPLATRAPPTWGCSAIPEHLYGCSSIEATTCTIVSSVPITEIFRYQGGRWRY